MVVIQLEQQNFMLMQNQNGGKKLGINREGYVLVYYRSSQMQECKNFNPAFEHLSNSNSNVEFASIDVSKFPKLVASSRETATPITNKLPLLIFYVNGKPLALFKGENNAPSVANFISNCFGSIQQQSQHHPQHQPQQHFVQPQVNNHQQRQQQSAPKIYTPEFGSAPSLTGLKNGKIFQPNEDDDDGTLLTPPNIVPKNVPWRLDTI